VVGQSAAVTTLENSLRERRIAHGYIFSGVRGVGKTTMARIFAKALNCSSGPTPEPCGECDSCREIAESRSLDVFEIDGASNSGVDKMRELLETVRYSPARDRHKIFIIDEFHQISRSAFNALLKTLEEPPPHVVFIMATTELGRVLPTILSRCQQFDFRRIPSSDIAAQLRTIADAEGITIADPTLLLLARAAEGSMRDALTALDQVIAACGSDVADDDARAVLGVIPEEEIEAFLAGIAKRDAAGLLRLIARVSDAGYDMVAFGAEVYRAARKLLITRTLPDAAAILDLSAEEAERAADLAGRFGEDDLLRIVHIIESIQPGLRYSAQPRFLLEASAVRLTRLADLAPVEEILAMLGGSETGAWPGRIGASSPRASAPKAAAPSENRAPRPAVTRQPLTPASTRTGSAAAKKKLPAEAGGNDPAPGGPPLAEMDTPAPSTLPGEGELPPEAGLFERVLARVESYKPGLAASLGMADNPREEEDCLVLPYAERSSFRRRVDEPGNLSLIARTASEIAGRPVRVRTVSSGPAAGVDSAAGAKERKKKEITERALNDPAVKTVMELFRARIVDVEEKK
jgi:DNA polymerase-3 subunit gamma/tau